MKVIYKENALRYEDYFALRQQIGWNNLDQTQTRNALSKDIYNIVAMHEGKVIAMGRLLGDGLYYMIVDVIVHDAYQGKGIGRCILQHILAYIEDRTPQASKASVQLIATNGKEAFYEKLGFERIPNLDNGCCMKQLILK